MLLPNPRDGRCGNAVSTAHPRNSSQGRPRRFIMVTIPTNDTTATAPNISPTGEYFMRRVIELIAYIKQLDDNIVENRAMIKRNTKTRNTLARELRHIDSIYYPDGFTTRTRTKVPKLQSPHTSGLVDGMIAERNIPVVKVVLGLAIGFFSGLIIGFVIQYIIVTQIKWMSPMILPFWIVSVLGMIAIFYSLFTKPKDPVSPVYH